MMGSHNSLERPYCLERLLVLLEAQATFRTGLEMLTHSLRPGMFLRI